MLNALRFALVVVIASGFALALSPQHEALATSPSLVITDGTPTPPPGAAPFVAQAATPCGTVGKAATVTCSFATAPSSTGTNMMLAFVLVGNSASTVTAPSGWTLQTDVYGQVCKALNGSGAQGLYVYGRMVQAADPAGPYQFGLSPSDAMVESLVEVDGVSVTTPIDRCYPWNANGSNGTISGSPLTATVANELPMTGYAPSTSGLGVSVISPWLSVSLYNNTQTPYATQSVQRGTTLAAAGTITAQTTFTGVTGSIVYVPIVPVLLVPTGSVVATPTPSACCSNAVQWPANFEPYAASSVWNKPISNISNPTLWPNSDSIVQHAMTTSMSQQLWATDINLSNTCSAGTCAADFGHPIYFAQNTDPIVNVNCTNVCGHAPATMYIPAKARPGNINGDDHIAVVQPDGTEIDTFRTVFPSGDYGTTGNTTLTASTVNTCGNFYNGPGFTGNTDSSTVGDSCLGGGMIRENEAVADAVGDSGTIKHALFITMQCGTRGSSAYVYPAMQQFDNQCGDNQPSFYNGAHLWSDYSDAQVDALYPGAVGTADAVTRAILKAMHHYGGYMLDSGGGAQTSQQPNFFFEDSGQYTATNGSNTSPWATYGAGHGWGSNTGGAFGTADYWTFNGSFNPLSSVGGWPAHLHWIDPCYAQGTC